MNDIFMLALLEEKSGGLGAGILSGVIGAVGAVLVGWLKNRDMKTGELEKLDIKYAWPTFLIGALVGVVAGLTKKAPSDLVGSLEASPIYAGVVFAVEAGWKAIFRNTAPLIKETMGFIKDGGKDQNPTPPQ